MVKGSENNFVESISRVKGTRVGLDRGETIALESARRLGRVESRGKGCWGVKKSAIDVGVASLHEARAFERDRSFYDGCVAFACDPRSPKFMQSPPIESYRGWWTIPYFSCKTRQWLISYSVNVRPPDSRHGFVLPLFFPNFPSFLFRRRGIPLSPIFLPLKFNPPLYFLPLIPQ